MRDWWHRALQSGLNAKCLMGWHRDTAPGMFSVSGHLLATCPSCEKGGKRSSSSGRALASRNVGNSLKKALFERGFPGCQAVSAFWVATVS